MTEHEAKALLTNFSTKIFHTVGDKETAEYACSLLGMQREVFVNYTPNADAGMGEEIFGTAKGSFGVSETYQPTLQSIALLSGLRSGGAANGYWVDGIVIRNGEAFRSGKNWLLVAFSQK